LDLANVIKIAIYLQISSFFIGPIGPRDAREGGYKRAARERVNIGAPPWFLIGNLETNWNGGDENHSSSVNGGTRSLIFIDTILKILK
jgi:hypothetical protein